MRSMEERGAFTKFWFSILLVVVALFAVISCRKRSLDTNLYSGQTNRDGEDTLYAGETIRDGETMVSPNGTFELGFFSPKNCKNRYVGIWSKVISSRQYASTPIIGVLNSDTPLVNTSGELSVTLEGSVVIRYANNGHVVWEMGKKSGRKLSFKLLDTGEFTIEEDLTGGAKLGCTFGTKLISPDEWKVDDL